MIIIIVIQIIVPTPYYNIINSRPKPHTIQRAIVVPVCMQLISLLHRGSKFVRIRLYARIGQLITYNIYYSQSDIYSRIIVSSRRYCVYIIIIMQFAMAQFIHFYMYAYASITPVVLPIIINNQQPQTIEWFLRKMIFIFVILR